jgi:hypothetical protein
MKLPEVVHPRMADLDYPASWLKAFFLGFGLDLAPLDMGRIAKILHALSDLLAEITSVGAKILLNRLGRLLDLRQEDWIDLRRVVLVRPCDDDRQRDATPVYENMPLASIFPPCP